MDFKVKWFYISSAEPASVYVTRYTCITRNVGVQLKPAYNANPGRRKATSPLITGNDEIDRQRFQILCVINNTGPTKIARELGLKPQTVSGVIHRRYNIRRVIRYLEELPHQLDALDRITGVI